MHEPYMGLPKSVFAPLRGWYFYKKAITSTYQVFAPLRGWYGDRHKIVLSNVVFAPLRGWY